MRFWVRCAALTAGALLMATAPSGAQECGATCFNTCSGFVAGADMVVLRPFVGDPREIGLDILGAEGTLGFGENDYDISPRLWLGYVSQSGLGVRARWWKFDHDLDAETGEATIEDVLLSTRGALDMYLVDVEVTQQMQFGLWQANAGGGLRVAGTSRYLGVNLFDPEDEASFDLTLANWFDGIGPTLFTEFRRPIGSCGLALVATGRGSVLFGSRHVVLTGTDEFGVLPGTLMSLGEEHDTVLGIAEIQMGAEWAKDLSGGSRLFLNTLWEGQYWASSGGLLNLINNDVGLMGFSVGCGLMR